jgi:hypothetical protein
VTPRDDDELRRNGLDSEPFPLHDEGETIRTLRQELARERASQSAFEEGLRALPADMPLGKAIEMIDDLRQAGRDAGNAVFREHPRERERHHEHEVRRLLAEHTPEQLAAQVVILNETNERLARQLKDLVDAATTFRRAVLDDPEALAEMVNVAPTEPVSAASRRLVDVIVESSRGIGKETT